MQQKSYLSILFISLMLTLGGCVSPQPAGSARVDSGVPITLTAAQIKTIQAGVQRRLKDPESARFEPRVLAARKPNGDISACGMVNAKNSFGGYVGMSPFIATLRNGEVVDSATGSGRDSEFIIILCRQDGVPV